MPVVSGSPVLRSEDEGELVSVRVKVEARSLEEALETLAALPFPVNPELTHRGVETEIKFPAYKGRLHEVREAFVEGGLAVGAVEATPMMEAIRER